MTFYYTDWGLHMNFRFLGNFQIYQALAFYFYFFSSLNKPDIFICIIFLECCAYTWLNSWWRIKIAGSPWTMDIHSWYQCQIVLDCPAYTNFFWPNREAFIHFKKRKFWSSKWLYNESSLLLLKTCYW